jgi:hypothetical protein
VPAPAFDALVRWPADWGCRFTLLIDVEEEFDWRAPLDPRHRSTSATRALPEAHRRFRDAGVAMGLMVDHPIATDPASVDRLAAIVADGRSAIGAQLHAWVTPPFDEGEGGVADSFQGNLPPALEAAKLDTLVAAIDDAFGTRPRAFRAGRYGIGPASRALLASRGFAIDASVRAYHDYAAGQGPDFARVGNAAYRTDGLVELPSTTVFTGAARRHGPNLYRAAAQLARGPGLLARTGLLTRVPLTPEGVPAADAIAAIDAAIGDGERLLVFSFHSPSLEPGHTPYVRDAAGLARFWAWWDAVLAHLARRGVANVSIGEVLAAIG